MTLTAARMRSLPNVFRGIDGHRRRQGLPAILSLATAATLSGMRGCKAIGEWVHDPGPGALKRFHVRRRNGQRRPPGLSTTRSAPVGVDPARSDAALRAWREAAGVDDSAPAIDGKTVRGAIDDNGEQPHAFGIAGHDSRAPRAQRKSA